MLIKEICQQCIVKHYNECGLWWNEGPKYNLHEWESAGRVLCPHKNPQYSLWISVNESPPTRCPYTLEHVIHDA